MSDLTQYTRRPKGRRGVTTFAVLVVSVVAMLIVAAPASAHGIRAPVFGPNAEPYGQSYSEWAADWWTWVLTQPADVNPLLDETGANCAQGQSGRVWFLAGTFGAGTAERTCTVPKHTALLFPVLNNFSGATSTDPYGEKNETFQRDRARSTLSGVSSLSASVDGVEVPFIRRYYEESEVFGVVLPPGNVFGLNGSCRGDLPIDGGCVVFPTVDVGYYLMVRPLREGVHTIKFAGTADFGTVSIEYTIIVSGRGDAVL